MNKRPYPCEDEYQCPSKKIQTQKNNVSEKTESYIADHVRKAVKNVKQYYEQLLIEKDQELRDLKEQLKLKPLKPKQKEDPPSYIS